MKRIYYEIKGLLDENAKESFALFLSLTSGCAFLTVSFLEFYFCVVHGSPGWTHYEPFSMWTAGGGIMTGIGNKIVNTHKEIKTGARAATSGTVPAVNAVTVPAESEAPVAANDEKPAAEDQK